MFYISDAQNWKMKILPREEHFLNSIRCKFGRSRAWVTRRPQTLQNPALDLLQYLLPKIWGAMNRSKEVRKSEFAGTDQEEFGANIRHQLMISANTTTVAKLAQYHNGLLYWMNFSWNGTQNPHLHFVWGCASHCNRQYFLNIHCLHEGFDVTLCLNIYSHWICSIFNPGLK